MLRRESLMTETLIETPTRSLFLPYLALCFANAAEAVEVLGAGYILARVSTDKTEQSLIGAGVYLGMLVGGLISGITADRRGRSVVLKFSLTLATLASVIAAASPNLVFLVICRVLAGVGVGSAMPALFALASELAPPGRSAMAVCAVASFWMVGSLFTAGTAYALFGGASQHQLEPSWKWNAHWRKFALATAGLPVFSVLLCCAWVRDPKQCCPDTHSRAEAGSHGDRLSMASPSAREGDEIRIAGDMPGGAQDGGSFSDDELHRPPVDASLFKGEMLRWRLLPLTCSWFGLSFGYYGLATWVTVLLKQSGIDNEYVHACTPPPPPARPPPLACLAPSALSRQRRQPNARAGTLSPYSTPAPTCPATSRRRSLWSEQEAGACSSHRWPWPPRASLLSPSSRLRRKGAGR
jgi:MFS family permease